MSTTGPHRVELESWISCAPFERLLQMTIESAEAGRAVLSMPFAGEMAQGAGLMHGGALVSLADTACGMAVKSLLRPWVRFATTDMQIRFLRPVVRGHVTARAAVLGRQDRRLQTEALVYDDEGRAVMELSATFKVARAAPAPFLKPPKEQAGR